MADGDTRGGMADLLIEELQGKSPRRQQRSPIWTGWQGWEGAGWP